MVHKTKEEISKKALELLRSPDFFGHYLEAMERTGVVGEERNAIVTLVVGVSRLLPKPINLNIKASSSAGKNHLASRALSLFPEDAVRELTGSSATAWNYSEDDFRHRIVYLQEQNEASGAVHPVRLLISENRLIRKVTVGSGRNRRVETFTTEGPIASISTTTRNQLEIDDETRHISIWIDESKEQTRRITRAYARDTEELTPADIETWRQAHVLLEKRARLPVRLPDWYQHIGDNVYDGDLRVRRYFPAFTTALKAVSILRSFQTSTPAADKLEVDFTDFWVTAILFEPVFVESIHRGDDGHRETRSIVDRIARRKGGPVHVTDLMRELAISKDSAYTRLREALQKGAIRRINKPSKGNRKLFVPSPRPRFLPDPDELFRSTPEAGSWVRFVHPLNGEWVIEHRSV